MNEVRRARIGTEVVVLTDVIRRLNTIIETEQRAHANLPDSIEFSLYGHSSEHAANLMITAGAGLMDVIKLLEDAKAVKHQEVPVDIDPTEAPCLG